MTIVDVLKKYKTYHLPEAIEYPAWIFDFDNDSPEKHLDMSKWDKIQSKFKSLVDKIADNNFQPQNHLIWVEYGFSPLVYKEFESEINNNISRSNLAFSNFLKNGYFDLNPDFQLHIFRAVKLYEDDSEILFGKDGGVYYFVMSDDEHNSFSSNDAKLKLNLDDITKIEYKTND